MVATLLGRFAVTAGTSCVLSVELLRVAADRHNSAATAIVLVASAFPPIMLSGVAGWLADTQPAPRVVALTGLGGSGCAALLPWPTSLAWQAALVAAVGIAAGALGPSLVAHVARTARADRIGAAMANQQAAVAVGVPSGAAAGATSYGIAGVAGAAGVTVGFFLVAAACGLALGSPAAPATTKETGPPLRWRAMASPAAGLASARSDRLLWKTAMCTLSMGLVLGTITPLEVLLARDAIGMTPAQFGLAEAFVFAGNMLGIQSSRALATDARRAGAAVSAMGVAGGLVIVLGLSRDALAFWVAVGLTGTATGLTSACLGSLIATRTAPERRGRVAASLSGLGGLVNALSLGVGGVLGTLLPLRVSFVAAGTGAVLVAGTVAGLSMTMRPKRRHLAVQGDRVD